MACPWVLDWLWPLKALLSETDSWTACSTNLKNMRGGCKRCVERIHSLPTNKVYPPKSAEELSACWSQLRQAILQPRSVRIFSIFVPNKRTCRCRYSLVRVEYQPQVFDALIDQHLENPEIIQECFLLAHCMLRIGSLTRRCLPALWFTGGVWEVGVKQASTLILTAWRKWSVLGGLG